MVKAEVKSDEVSDIPDVSNIVFEGVSIFFGDGNLPSLA